MEYLLRCSLFQPLRNPDQSLDKFNQGDVLSLPFRDAVQTTNLVLIYPLPAAGESTAKLPSMKRIRCIMELKDRVKKNN